MSTHPKRTAHHVGDKPGDIHFGVGPADSRLRCSCGTRLTAPTPELLEREFAAHRGQTRFRALAKAPGYLYGGAFK